MRSGQSNEMNEQKKKLFRVLRSHGNDKNTFFYYSNELPTLRLKAIR